MILLAHLHAQSGLVHIIIKEGILAPFIDKLFCDSF